MTILGRILDTKRNEVAAAQVAQSQEAVREAAAKAPPPRDFAAAIMAPSPRGIQLIAEVKKASPSAGVIVRDFDPVAIARGYHAHGAAAISVLTDETYFQGRLEYIEKIKKAVPLPVLRKDFIIDAYQVYESRAAGADAVLLIADVLGVSGVLEMLPLAQRLKMTPLVEVHALVDLRAILQVLGPPRANAYILGINNRDLHMQKTSLSATLQAGAILPKGVPFVSESGISTREDVKTVLRAGACAILVGESLLKAKSIETGIERLFGKA